MGLWSHAAALEWRGGWCGPHPHVHTRNVVPGPRETRALGLGLAGLTSPHPLHSRPRTFNGEGTPFHVPSFKCLFPFSKCERASVRPLRPNVVNSVSFNPDLHSRHSRWPGPARGPVCRERPGQIRPHAGEQPSRLSAQPSHPPGHERPRFLPSERSRNGFARFTSPSHRRWSARGCCGLSPVRLSPAPPGSTSLKAGLASHDPVKIV